MAAVMEESEGEEEEDDVIGMRGLSAADALRGMDSEGDSEAEAGGVASDDDEDEDEEAAPGPAATVEEEEAANLAKLSAGDVIAGKVFCSACPMKTFVKGEDYLAHVTSKVTSPAFLM